jgi:RNA polymerase sigma-54 factor
MELRQVVRQELGQNPTLEEVQERKEGDAENQDENYDEETRNLIEEMEKIASTQELWQESLRNLNYPDTVSDEEKDSYSRTLLTVKPNLQTHLLRQLRISDCPDYNLGELIIGNIDEDGYLRTSTQEIAAISGSAVEKVEEILALIQTFGPAGIGARNLKECLLIQLRARQGENPLAMKIVSKYLEELEKKKYSQIARNLTVDIEDVREATKIIAALEPKPGYKFNPVSPQYILPDVSVKKIDGEYQIIVNDADLPMLRINPFYKKLLKNDRSPETQKYLTEKFKSALWFIKSIEQRKRTIYRVAECIVKRQREFLDKGISFLKPLRLKDIARELNLHESTVSRVTSNKYIETVQGVFELKYFLSGALQNDEDRAMSTRSIKAKIAEVIKNENPGEPFSDNEIAELMKKNGINIARRTVAKYRERLRILPSNLRK